MNSNVTVSNSGISLTKLQNICNAQSPTSVKNEKDYELIRMKYIQLVCFLLGEKPKNKITRTLDPKNGQYYTSVNMEGSTMFSNSFNELTPFNHLTNLIFLQIILVSYKANIW